MIGDRHAPMDLCALAPQLQVTFEPDLAAVDRLLDDDVLFQQVKADLARRYPQTATRGRKLRTDSTLLANGVRVLSRLVGRAKSLVGTAAGQAHALLRDLPRPAKRLARQIQETVRRRGPAAEGTTGHLPATAPDSEGQPAPGAARAGAPAQRRR
jgi:hypothetical protein